VYQYNRFIHWRRYTATPLHLTYLLRGGRTHPCVNLEYVTLKS